MIRGHAWGFFESPRRMTPEEREVVFVLLRFGCPGDLPENVHINVDYLRRLTHKPPARLKRILGGLRSPGFDTRVREATEEEAHDEGELLGECYLFQLTWADLRDRPQFEPLVVAYEMVLGATENYCEEHGKEFLDRLDFSQLGSVTSSAEASRI